MLLTLTTLNMLENVNKTLILCAGMFLHEWKQDKREHNEVILTKSQWAAIPKHDS